MKEKIKKVLLLLFCLVFAALYATGCLSGASDLLLTGNNNQTQDADDTDDNIDSKLNELKDKRVNAPVVLSHRSGEEIYGSGDRELIFIKGQADKGNTIEVYVNGVMKLGNIAVNDDGDFETPSGVEITEGKNVIELAAANSSGNKSDPTKFNIFLIVPPEVEYSIYEDSGSLTEITDFYYSTQSNPTVYIRGSHLPNSQVSIQINDRVVGEVESSEEGIFELEDVTLKSGDNEIAVWAVTEDGYINVPVFKDVMVYKDLSVPYPSSLSGYQQGNANYLSWNDSIDSNFDSYKLVRVEDPCINPEYPDNDVIATFSNINTNSYVDDDIEEGKSYYYTLWTLDKAGRVVSSNVVAIPKPVYSIAIEGISPFGDTAVIGRREWFYQYYEITNTGNVTIDLQPMMAWLKLSPNPEEDMEISPLWEVHIWNPNEPGQYYYSNEDVKTTYIADWVGGTVIEKKTTYETEDLTVIRVVTETKTTKKVEGITVNLKRLMMVTTETTVTKYYNTTGKVRSDPEETTDTSTEIVEPEEVGTAIEGLEPGEKIKIGIKIQNVSADVNEKITVHFNFAPVDCDGYFFIDEIVSTGDIVVTSSGRN